MHTKRSRLFAPVVAAVAGLTAVFLQATTAEATIRTVINNNDAGAGSLRQAIADSVNGDTINFSVTGTIAITSAPLVLNKSLTIIGPGARTLNVSATANVVPTIFGSSGTSTISALTLGPGSNAMNLTNAGVNVTLNNCAIVNNIHGGGILPTREQP